MHDEPFKMTGLAAGASYDKQEIWVPVTLNRAAFAKKERLSRPASSMDRDRVHAQFVLKTLCTPRYALMKLSFILSGSLFVLRLLRLWL